MCQGVDFPKTGRKEKKKRKGGRGSREKIGDHRSIDRIWATTKEEERGKEEEGKKRRFRDCDSLFFFCARCVSLFHRFLLLLNWRPRTTLENGTTRRRWKVEWSPSDSDGGLPFPEKKGRGEYKKGGKKGFL